MNVNLIGMRSSGKSNVSRRLAVPTKRQVFSTDLLIQYERGGQSISDFVADEGWMAFRDLEFEVVRKVCAVDGVIVDCGGGVIVDVDAAGVEVFSDRKVDALRAAGPIVWLRGDVDRLAAKAVASDKSHRPELSDSAPLADLMRAREPFYERATDLVVDIDGKLREEVAFEILAQLRADLMPYT